MHAKQFQNFVANLHKLSPPQLQQLRAALSENDALQKTWAEMTQATGGLCCHHCGSTKVVKNGFENGLQRLRCKECGRSCNCVSGTPLSRLRNKEKFATYARCLEQGMTLRQAAQTAQLNLDRAFRWRHRFLQAGTQHQAREVEGSYVEKTTLYFSASSKGRSKHGAEECRAGGKVVPVVLGKIFQNAHLVGTCDLVLPAVGKQVMVASAGMPAMQGPQWQLQRLFGEMLQRERSPEDGGLAETAVQSQRQALSPSAMQEEVQLRGWLQGRLRGVSSKYLPNYLAWQRMRTWQEHGLNAQQILVSALGKQIINV